MQTLDHTAYPDILDRIIDLSPPEALASLRLASRYCRDRATAALLSHAVLEPRWLEAAVPPWHSDDASSWPYLFSLKGRWLPYLPHLVRTLDVRSDNHPSEELSGEFTSLDTLRRMRGAYADPYDDFGDPRGFTYPPFFQPSAATVVDFVEAPFGYTPGLDIAVHASERYILHVDLIRTDEESHGLSIRNALQTPNFTLVLWARDREPLEFPRYILFEALFHFTRDLDAETPLCFTVVGLEDMLPEPNSKYVWGRGENTQESLWDGLMAFLADECGHCTPRAAFWDDPVLAEEVGRGFRVLSREQWWEELGDRRELVGVWPPEASAGP
ncbi:uncharacterized protein LOC62_04G005346 [Vanrija pseudolonga]|uniref:Uncharacterized protein n=1 Tax=Vanrija pseudolonga TaxID=143232 RepID=A0AAF0Y7V2_9TREE|nr:hypothetical protein LOC62_04G005346 [Vanrija pseudolonga]